MGSLGQLEEKGKKFEENWDQCIGSLTSFSFSLSIWLTGESQPTLMPASRIIPSRAGSSRFGLVAWDK